ncbi:hypothetical protein BASA60_009408 [Batrachochytrium salamandrivorans]|nr:hypothetical protein BASA60_009408 [Batrachochytrium salamandrivorans]
MKLQGVFMITPLLAVVASGITIPSTDGYNVQQLEKRSDSEPDNNEPGDEGPRRDLRRSGSNGGARSKTSGRHSDKYLFCYYHRRYDSPKKKNKTYEIILWRLKCVLL